MDESRKCKTVGRDQKCITDFPCWVPITEIDTCCHKSPNVTVGAKVFKRRTP